MSDKKFLYACAASLLAAALASSCGGSHDAPTSPSSANPAAEATADGPDNPTLKASAPVAVSPVDGQELLDGALVITNATAQFAAVPMSYRFRVFDASNRVVYTSPLVPAGANGRTTHVFDSSALEFDKPYTWNAYAEYDGAATKASANASFRSASGGFIRGNEMYDPLWNGKTIGRTNDVDFVPGVGVRLNSRDSFVEYVLQEPCIDCTASFLATNLGNGSETWKTKVFSMLRGDGVNTTENAYRVTLDKRTTWVGQGSVIRYTMRSRGVDAGEPKSGPQSWNRQNTYFWMFDWRGGIANLTVRDGGINGNVKASLPTKYKAPYSPSPHIVRLGSVGGRAENETNPGTIIWNLWVSPNPRPTLPRDK